MQNLRLKNHANARVWLGKLPKAGFPVAAEQKRIFPAKAKFIPNWRSQVCVEISAPVGARFLYGLLGGTYEATDSGELVATVCSTLRDGAPYSDSLVSKVDNPRIGLPNDYVDAVFGGIGYASRHIDNFSGGNLRISHAVHGDVGSSEIVFAQISAVLMRLMYLPGLEVSDEILIELFPASIGLPLEE